MPGTYRLGERATRMEATRVRILEAAIELYTEVGISRATFQEIARRADVAPGTLRNHFRSRDGIDRALVAYLTADAPLPEPSVLDGAMTMEGRIAHLVRVTGTFLDQSARLYRMWQREPLLAPAWSEAGARYGARWAELMRAALGTLADDEDAMSILRAVLQPTFFEHVGAGRRSTAEVAQLIASAITPWLVARAGGQTGG